MAENEAGVLTLILDQVRSIDAEVKHIPVMQSRMETLDTAMREMAAELRTRDHAQQQAIELLKATQIEMQMEQSKIFAAIAGVSNSVNELKFALSEQGQRLVAVEQQVKANFDARLELGRRVREIEDITEKLRVATDQFDCEVIKKTISELDSNRPWIQGIIWFLKILFGLLGLSAAGGLIWVLGQALTGGL